MTHNMLACPSTKLLFKFTVTEFWALQVHTLSGGECRTSGHFLETQLEDHNLSNNNDILGQKAQTT